MKYWNMVNGKPYFKLKVAGDWPRANHLFSKEPPVATRSGGMICCNWKCQFLIIKLQLRWGNLKSWFIAVGIKCVFLGHPVYYDQDFVLSCSFAFKDTCHRKPFSGEVSDWRKQVATVLW